MEYRILDDYRLFSKMAGFSFSVTAKNQSIYEQRHQEIFHEKREFLGAFDNDGLAAGLILYPYMMNFRNNLIKTFGVGDVCSRADKRGKGEVRYLLNESVRLMYSRSAGLSVLYPFNYDFYRGSGWEVFTNSAMYLLSPSQLKTLPETDNIKAVDMDFPDKQGIEYHNKKVCGKYNHVIRSEIDWKDQLRMFSDNEIKRGVVQFYKNSQVCGMMTYVYSYIPKEDSTVFTIRTFFYDDFETKNKMFLFIKKLSAQISSVSLLAPNDFILFAHLSNSPVALKKGNHCMIRIIDINALDGIFFDSCDADISVELTDSVIKENNGCFRFIIDNKKLRISRTENAAISTDIGTFSSVLSGYVGIKDMIDCSKIKIMGKYDGTDFKKECTFITELF